MAVLFPRLLLRCGAARCHAKRLRCVVHDIHMIEPRIACMAALQGRTSITHMNEATMGSSAGCEACGDPDRGDGFELSRGRP
ncbi:hypothetical protein VFPFJ_02819 [Purpureocillium lilacinum]|uniref:Uncharacterized protein n=1 Tax=Purpureocillium lilacinum TaxID=33203 RepID=A0A179HTG3_PURLI|nr:hypothetical protein VFPFJ_02819 [Purpureocillium lilacinum]OAQ93657.1 hypothetical protein VFPFJ_02819 [Purpureocillium lilacinum]